MIYDPNTERLDAINENLSLIQYKDGLTFGTDSYLLAAFTRFVKNGIAAEFGGGTGVVSLLAASRGRFQQIHCAEIQPYFADLIRRNAELNGLGERVLPVMSDIRDLTPETFGCEVHAVFSNPPYMKAGSGRDNASPEMNTARREENGTIFDFTAAARKLLRHGGYFTAVYRPDRLAELLHAMRENHLEPKRVVLVYPSVSDKPCLVLAEGKKGASAGMVVSRPLIIYEDKASGQYTADMTRVYEEFSLEFLF